MSITELNSILKYLVNSNNDNILSEFDSEKQYFPRNSGKSSYSSHNSPTLLQNALLLDAVLIWFNKSNRDVKFFRRKGLLKKLMTVHYLIPIVLNGWYSHTYVLPDCHQYYLHRYPWRSTIDWVNGIIYITPIFGDKNNLISQRKSIWCWYKSTAGISGSIAWYTRP